MSHNYIEEANLLRFEICEVSEKLENHRNDFATREYGEEDNAGLCFNLALAKLRLEEAAVLLCKSQHCYKNIDSNIE